MPFGAENFMSLVCITYIYICVCMCVHIYTYIGKYTCIYLYMYIYIYRHTYFSNALYASLLLFLDHLAMFPSKPISNPPKVNHFLFNDLVFELSILQMNYILCQIT